MVVEVVVVDAEEVVEEEEVAVVVIGHDPEKDAGAIHEAVTGGDRAHGRHTESIVRVGASLPCTGTFRHRVSST